MRTRDRSASSQSIAVLWVLVATAIFTVIYASGKLMGGAIPALQMLFFRYVSGFVLVTVVAVLSGRSGVTRTRRPLAHLTRACCGAFGGAATIQAATLMPVANASALGLLTGVLTILLGIAVLKEVVSPGLWGATLVSLAGALLVVLSQGGLALDGAYLWGAGFALIGAVLIALETILISTLSRSDRALTVLLYVNGFGVLLMAGPALVLWQPPTLGQIAVMVALGPLAITAQYCNIRGFRMAPASVLGPVDYTWLVFAAGLGAVVFGEIPAPLALVGFVLIVGGGVALTRVRAVQPADSGVVYAGATRVSSQATNRRGPSRSAPDPHSIT
ncbi:DMT family transporter [Roseospira marina]|uniref:DMT family transporter n=1 Tax=Roseospira marina TaxID=140057 RepID=A0A5M6IHF2_9PROT|nr:DMT family transporter [Roseospira marina]KAA5606988.1 DMT family transporter [Roseospira marina]MBB4312830.1 drug/metabolite transporter (DMT)-like permease [Roseospira marina]MBB5086397.1 drug/metabolite transporter (DMT)-like permease [Roseospira marina]